MVVGRRATEEWRADLIFRALADRTRRDVIRRAKSGTLSVSALARLYPMSTTAVQKHVAVLEEAGLVHLRRTAPSSSPRPRSIPSPRRKHFSPSSSSCGVVDLTGSATYSRNQ
jgi:predicted transcriptional regulator